MNAIYTPLRPDEMEFNTNFGRVRLNLNGPDADAEPGSDAYLGFSIVGENKTDFSVAMAAGLMIGMRGRTPILMAGRLHSPLYGFLRVPFNRAYRL